MAVVFVVQWMWFIEEQLSVQLTTHWFEMSFLFHPQAMKVVSKKKLLKQCGFPRTFCSLLFSVSYCSDRWTGPVTRQHGFALSSLKLKWWWLNVDLHFNNLMQWSLTGGSGADFAEQNCPIRPTTEFQNCLSLRVNIVNEWDLNKCQKSLPFMTLKLFHCTGCRITSTSQTKWLNDTSVMSRFQRT